MKRALKEFTLEELARYTGREGVPAFVAYQGEVRDFSGSFHWQAGRHQAMHEAGTDLTASLDRAPHGQDLLERFPVVGVLGA